MLKENQQSSYDTNLNKLLGEGGFSKVYQSLNLKTHEYEVF